MVAPGWLEPDPFAHYSAALTSGVVEEVTVLEGQRVKRDDIVARLIDDDAKLALSRAEADLGIAHAELARAKADLEAKHDVMESLVDRRRAVERGRALDFSGPSDEHRGCRTPFRPLALPVLPAARDCLGTASRVARRKPAASACPKPTPPSHRSKQR